MHRMCCSEELTEIVGNGPHTDVSLTRTLWAYILDNELLDDQMMVHPDEKLSKVLGTTRVLDKFELTRRVTPHTEVGEGPFRQLRADAPSDGGIPSLEDDLTRRNVQACITAVTFPETPEQLFDMIEKNADMSKSLTDIDTLLSNSTDIAWTAPRWMTCGDLLFFYHTKSARANLRRLRKEIEASAPDYDDLIPAVERGEEQAEEFSQTIFACGVVVKPSEFQAPNARDEPHFKSTIFAPLGKIHLFKHPLPASEFTKEITLSTGGTLTPLHGNTLTSLKTMLARKNRLPTFISEAQPGTANFRNVSAKTWLEILTRPGCAFIDEGQLRAYLLDYLLAGVKDPRTQVHAECECTCSGKRTGIVDYFVRISGTWVPVEAKLNIRAESNLPRQLKKYVEVDSFIPHRGPSRGRKIAASPQNLVLVFDQWGGYLFSKGKLITGPNTAPLWPRENLTKNSASDIRRRLEELLR